MIRTLSSIALAVSLLAAAGPLRAQYVSTPPPGQKPNAAAGEELGIVPKNGQSQEQLWADRYACYNWAREQSGFDPAKPAGGVTAPDPAAKSADYRRAFSACMEGRGYSVGRAAAGTAPPPPPPRSAPPSPATLSPRAPARLERVYPAQELRYHPFTAQVHTGYTVTEGAANTGLHDGWNVGFGFTWFPSAELPLGLRVDGSYSEFRQRHQFVDSGSSFGPGVLFGHESVYGGDVDLQLNLPSNGWMRAYLLGGVGWYREHTRTRVASYETGIVCFFACYSGYVPAVSTVGSSTSDWLRAWNAGLGVEFSLGDPLSLFVEARYQRMGAESRHDEFVPIRVGVRF